MPAPLDVTTSKLFVAALGTEDDPVVAAVFGVSPNTVRNHRVKRGIPSYRSVRRSAVKHLIEAGHNDSAIERDTGMDRRAVARYRAKLGVPNPFTATALNTEAAVAAYVEEHPTASPRKIAAALGIAHSWVRVLLARE